MSEQRSAPPAAPMPAAPPMPTAAYPSKRGAPKFVAIQPTTVEEFWRLACIAARGHLVPEHLRGKPEDCFIAMTWGAELGLSWNHALQAIAIINGRASVWGDTMLALVKASGELEYLLEWVEWEPCEGREFESKRLPLKACCKVKRVGEEERYFEWTRDDAMRAGLWFHPKKEPWQRYPARMLAMRNRSWCLRDVFPDVLRGLHSADELVDIELPASDYREVVPQPKASGDTPSPESPQGDWEPLPALEAPQANPLAQLYGSAADEQLERVGVVDADAQREASTPPFELGDGLGEQRVPISAGQRKALQRQLDSKRRTWQELVDELGDDVFVDNVQAALGIVGRFEVAE